MQKVLLQYGKTSLLLAVVFSVFCFMNTAHCQQHIIANKNNTRPETTIATDMAARITLFSVVPFNGYNEIRWSALREEDTRRYVAEYSSDGINFQSAGEMLAANGEYSLKHFTADTRSLLYRIRIETNNGRFNNTASILLIGADQPPVKVYPTIIETNIVNLQMSFPVQRIALVAADGRQVFTKQVGGQTGLLQITLPPVGEGIYFISFYGEGWKSSDKLLIR